MTTPGFTTFTPGLLKISQLALDTVVVKNDLSFF